MKIDVKRWIGIVLLACLLFMPVRSAYAVEFCEIIGHYTAGNHLYFYVSGLAGEVEDAFCEVEDHTGKFCSASDAEEDGLHTLILWDAVTPYDEVKQEHLKEVVGELIANRSGKETFTIAQAGEQLIYSIEESGDYAELMSVVNELGNGEEVGTLLPMVYEAVNDMAGAEHDGICRILIVTDGGREEVEPDVKNKLSAMLDCVGYPIYVLEWPGDEVVVGEETFGEDVCLLLEEMGAEYAACTKEMSPLEVAIGFSKEYNVVKIETKIPAGEREDSRSQVVLTIVTTEGVYEGACTMAVPSGEVEKTEGLKFFLWKYKKWFIWSGIGIAGIVFVIFLIVFVNKRKRYKVAKANYYRDAEAATISRQHACTEEDTTVMHKIKLTDRGDEMKTYQSGFKGAVIIGRNPSCCTLLLNGDNSISGRHCGIYVRRGHFYIRDLNSSNGTKVNGIPLAEEIEIRTGDVVKLGRAEYTIRLE